MATWAIHPALPTGLHFNTGNGTITGTPERQSDRNDLHDLRQQLRR